MKFLTFFVLSFLSFSIFAETLLTPLFQEGFDKLYVSGRCGDNILRLIAFAKEKNIDLKGAKVLEISNPGMTNFGLVNVEYARQGGRIVEETRHSKEPKFYPGEKNWYHHVVLEYKGYIYDFDYGNTPEVAPIKDYFEKMFLNEKKENEGGEFYIGRNYKLKDYELVPREANIVLESRTNKLPLPEGKKLKLSQYLSSITP